MKRMDGFDKCILQSLIPWGTKIADVDCSVAVHFSLGSAKKKFSTGSLDDRLIHGFPRKRSG